MWNVSYTILIIVFFVHYIHGGHIKQVKMAIHGI